MRSHAPPTVASDAMYMVAPWPAKRIIVGSKKLEGTNMTKNSKLATSMAM